MPLTINLRHLEKKGIEVSGELTTGELDLGPSDELVKANESLEYDLAVERIGETILVQGRLSLPVRCQCARCLKEFQDKIELDPWTCSVPLEGEDKVPVVNDCVDLTPFVREDILLAFPQHPLCDLECGGLPYTPPSQEPARAAKQQQGSSAWDELDKLKL